MPVRLRGALAGVLFCVTIAGALDPRVLRNVPLAAAPDRAVPSYPLFLREVAAHTRPGQSVVIAAPMRRWDSGYSYAYYRASYFLSGRRVIPVIDPDDSLHLERLGQADMLALWKMGLPGGPFEVVWRGHDGTLYRRIR